jgi:ureidoacrylate peracid hydrolase
MPKVTWPIVPRQTALLVIDMQNDFVREGAPLEVVASREAIDRLNALADACRAAGATVIFVRHVLRADRADAGRYLDLNLAIREGRAIVAGTEGVELYPKLDVRPGDLHVTKPRYSAFHGTDLEAILHTRGIDTLLIGGTLTQVCCDATVKDAFSRDYKIVVLSDGVSARGFPDVGWGALTAEEITRVVLSTTVLAFGQVATTAEMLAALRSAT